MLKNRKNTIIAILLLLLVVLIIRLYIAETRPAYEIAIGRPVVGENNFVSAIDFSKSEPLKSKAQVNDIIFNFLYADNAETDEIMDIPPTAGLWIRDAEGHITYTFSLWLTEDAVYYAPGAYGLVDGEQIHCRKLENKYAAPKIQEIVEGQLALYDTTHDG